MSRQKNEIISTWARIKAIYRIATPTYVRKAIGDAEGQQLAEMSAEGLGGVLGAEGGVVHAAGGLVVLCRVGVGGFLQIVLELGGALAQVMPAA